MTIKRGHIGRDHMVFVSTTTCNSAHHHLCEFESRSGKVYSIQHYVIKFVRDLRQFGGFLWVLEFPLNKIDRYDIAEILL